MLARIQGGLGGLATMPSVYLRFGCIRNFCCAIMTCNLYLGSVPCYDLVNDCSINEYINEINKDVKYQPALLILQVALRSAPVKGELKSVIT